MLAFKNIKIRSHEIGLYFQDREFRGLLDAGRHRFFDPLFKVYVDVQSLRHAQIHHEQLDVIVKSGALKERAVVLDLKDHQRALVWIDGRFHDMLGPGLYAYWNTVREVRVEVIDAREARFEHDDLRLFGGLASARKLLDICTVSRDHVGVSTLR